jgi:signal transduction histidine kinase
MGKLRNKIFILMALVGIVPLVVAAVLADYVVTNAHRDDVSKLESAVITQKAGEVQGFITQSVLGQTHVEIPYGPGINIDTNAQQYVLKQTLTSLPFIQSEAFVNLEGRQMTSADRLHLDGYSSSSLQDVSQSPAFQAAKAGGDYLSPVTYPVGVPTVLFASPVDDEHGQTIAVLTGIATLDPIQQIIASGTIGATGYLYLVDQNGALIAGGGPLAGDIGTSSTAPQASVQNVLAGSVLLTPDSQMRYKNIFGTNVVAAGAPMQEGGETWGIVAEWPTSEADAVINALLVRDIIILVIVLALVALASILLALFIIRPIKKLQEATARVAQGKFNEGVYIRTGDELEELGDSFNKMVMDLKQFEALKDEFVFIAAHELRTPVAAMKGYLTLILEGQTGGVNDQTKVFIEKVLGSNQRLIQLVNDLLEVARNQAGRLTIKVAPIDLAPPIASTLDELKSLADEKSITMKYDSKLADGGEIPKVLGDADRVKEVMINLVGNAIKYMGGSGTITVSHERKDAPVAAAAAGGSVIVTHIADTGLGMSRDAQEKLFQKFYRVQTEKTRDITGTGLGLFIVKEIIEKMGGTISVTSEEGKGSTFSFNLPIAP